MSTLISWALTLLAVRRRGQYRTAAGAALADVARLRLVQLERAGAFAAVSGVDREHLARLRSRLGLEVLQP